MIVTSTKELYEFNKKLSLLHYLGGLEYSSCIEYPLAINNLEVEPQHLVLDIGSSWFTPVPIFLAQKDCVYHATDISDKVFKLANIARKGGFGHLVNSTLITRVEDGRHLSFSDNYFDRVLSISAIEHIEEDNGDSEAMKEIFRVLKPGGKAVVTLPYRDVYQEDEKPYWVGYFTRFYNKTALNERIIEPSGLKLVKVEFFGEKPLLFNKLYFRQIWSRIPKYLQFGFISYALARRLIGIFKTEDEIRKYAKGGTVLLVLDKVLETYGTGNHY